MILETEKHRIWYDINACMGTAQSGCIFGNAYIWMVGVEYLLIIMARCEVPRVGDVVIDQVLWV